MYLEYFEKERWIQTEILMTRFGMCLEYRRRCGKSNVSSVETQMPINILLFQNSFIDMVDLYFQDREQFEKILSGGQDESTLSS